MRYILDSSGYVESVSCTPFNCKDKSCKEYTGTIPSGYDTLQEWATTANIRAYKITNNNLVYDSARDAALQAQWEQTDRYTQALGRAGKNLYPSGLTQVFSAPLIKLTKGTYTITEIDTTSGNWYLAAYKNGSVLSSGVSFSVAFNWSSTTEVWYRADTTLKGFTFTLNQDCEVQIGRLNATGAQKVQLELGSTATEYEEYYAPVIAVADSNGAIHEAGENYSLGEQRVGTYLGKLFYKKTFIVNSPSQTSSSEIIVKLDSNCSIVKYEGFLETNAKARYLLNCWFSSTDYVYSFISNLNEIKLRVSLSAYASRPIEITLWYTKN